MSDLPEMVARLRIESRQRCEAALHAVMKAVETLEPDERRRVYWKLIRIAAALDIEADNAE